MRVLPGFASNRGAWQVGAIDGIQGAGNGRDRADWERLGALPSTSAQLAVSLMQEELMQWLVTQPEADYQALPVDSPLRLELRPGIHFNSLLGVDTLDVHRDTPVELLHTYLLGVEKYSWYHIHNAWTDTQSELFATRLQASSLDGLSLPALRASWMLQHPNNLIGKHLKALQQLTVFHSDETLCDTLTFDLIKATGELGALLWFHEIDDLKEYQEDLTILIGNLLDIWSRIDPQRVFVKLKLHILLHILEDVRMHGPGILNSTEVFEAFNAVFRGSSILSNHLAPSRDIANSSAVMESYKHVVSGGWWKEENGTHVRAGFKVRQSFADPHVTGQLGLDGLSDKPEYLHCLQKIRKGPGKTWASLIIESVNPKGLSPRLDSIWHECNYVVSQHSDRCRVGSWVFADVAGETVAGRITDLLTPAEQGDNEGIVVLKQYTIPGTRHPHFGMPEVRRDASDDMHTVVRPKSILFNVNVQHNCKDSSCTASGRRVVRQERQDSNITHATVEHTNDTLYLLNTHALHHAALIRKALPRDLTKPQPYVIDRLAEHKQVAAKLRTAHKVRRQKDADARRARKEKVAAEKTGAKLGPVAGTESAEGATRTHEAEGHAAEPVVLSASASGAAGGMADVPAQTPPIWTRSGPSSSFRPTTIREHGGGAPGTDGGGMYALGHEVAWASATSGVIVPNTHPEASAAWERVAMGMGMYASSSRTRTWAGDGIPQAQAGQRAHERSATDQQRATGDNCTTQGEYTAGRGHLEGEIPPTEWTSNAFPASQSGNIRR